MNNATQINEHFQSIARLLNNRQLKQALDELETFVKDVPEWDLHTQFDEIRTAYHYMLQYFKQNANDPQRAQLYTDLLRQTCVLNERLMVAQHELVSSTLFYSTLREQKQNPRTLADYRLQLETFAEDMAMTRLLHQGDRLNAELDKLRTNHESAQNALFCKVWASPPWDANTLEEARKFLSSVLIPTNDAALLTSAVTLGLLQVFDARKFHFLFDAYMHNDLQVNQRALVGIVIACLCHEKRLAFEPELSARLTLLQEQPNFTSNLLEIQIQLLRSRETKKADRKMRDEIIPEVIKSSRELRNSKISLIDLDEEALLNDKNPEWKKWEENNNLASKMQELGNMQMEGIDVYMSTFAQLKTFPFFRNICNWFYPFDPQHSAVLQVFSEEEQQRNFMVRSILASPYFCNSDKYSFCFTMQHIPAKQREMFSANLTEQGELAQEAADMIKTERPTAGTISRQYLQDLYRFFKVYPRRHEFTDIFETLPLNFQDSPTLRTLLRETDARHKVAEYLFYKEYYTEALHMFEPLAQETEADAELYQKMGFCHQKNKDYHKAIEAYRQADLRKADTLWTIRHLAQCYRMMKKPEAALPYYIKALEMQPDNLTLLLQTGECEVEMGLYDDAFARFFKVEYLDAGSLRAKRCIAWCSFITGKYAQAGKYYDMLLDTDEPDVQDCLNAGHTAWVQGHTERAVALYLEGCRRKGDTEAFIDLLLKDGDELARQGIPTGDLPLMADVLRYGSSPA